MKQTVKGKGAYPFPFFKTRNLAILLLTMGFVLKAMILMAQPDGEKLFKQACASCHTTTDRKLVGPGLEGINDKRSEEWLIKWIKDSPSLIAEGDPDAVAIFEEFNKVPMPPQNFSDAEIKAMLGYIADANKPAPKTEEDAATGTIPVEGGGEGEAAGPRDYFTWFLLIGIAVFLIIVIKVLRDAKKAMQKYGAGEAPDSASGYESMVLWTSRHKKFVAVIAAIVVVFGLKVCWDSLATVGVAQDYQPVQPIKFSHKIHAGQNQISCVYCHSGAKKGKVAGIPSANVCMNCHTYVREGTKTGTTEIAKIYEALDYDPSTMSYGDNPKPIRWVRIHNLPDLAYFNHAQHVVAGQQECQTCHGPVEEMEEVKQYSPLTMGWCVNCHRETEVNLENEYYREFHDKYKEKYKGEKITVEKIGGLDCAKCHY